MTDPTSAATDRFAAQNAEAEALVEKSDLPAAARILVDIVEKDPGNARAINTMGIISWMRHAWQDAYTMFSRAVTLKPDYTDAHVNLFDAALKLRKIKDAYPLFDQAARQFPALEEIAIIRDAIRDQGDDIYSSERGLMIGSYHPLIEEANRLLDDGKIFEAMTRFMQVVDTEGPNAETYCGLGIISYYQQRYDDAFTLFLESIKLNPARTDTFLNLLDAAKACGKLETARKIYEIYVKELPMLSCIEAEFQAA